MTSMREPWRSRNGGRGRHRNTERVKETDRRRGWWDRVSANGRLVTFSDCLQCASLLINWTIAVLSYFVRHNVQFPRAGDIRGVVSRDGNSLGREMLAVVLLQGNSPGRETSW